MSLLLDGDLAAARVIVMRLHGELDERARARSACRHGRCREARPLVIVSGTGEPRADFAQRQHASASMSSKPCGRI